MSTIRVLVLRAAGINCDEETAYAWELAGADALRLHVNRLIEDPRLLEGFQILSIPGGFSYGDDIAAGMILGLRLARHLGDPLRGFIARGGLVLGICNGFQVLVRAGLLPGPACGGPVTLTLNRSGRYEDRWVRLRVGSSRCAFLERDEEFELPVAHAEGRFAVSSEAALAVLESRDCVALRYIAPDGGEPSYPDNPNGSIGNVAGLTDDTGRVLGLMPHPERYVKVTNAPHWTRGRSGEPDGLRIFRRAVRHFL